jgi:hypothetical protein
MVISVVVFYYPQKCCNVMHSVLAISVLLSKSMSHEQSLSVPTKWQRFFAMIQCAIKSFRLFNELVCIQFNMALLCGVIQLLITMGLYKDMSCTIKLWVSHTNSSICLFTRSHHGMSIHFATVVSERSWGHLWRRAHMEGDIGSVLMMTHRRR